MPATTISADQDKGTLTASTNSFTLKSGVDETGAEREFVEGFLATTHVDKGNDEFTAEALKQMAEDINGDNVDAVFNDVDTDALREATVGNLDHNNNPASPFGDTRTVPAFKIQEAEVRNMDEGEEKGLWIKAVLNTGGMLDETVSAVKNSIKNDFLNAFSVEFIPKKVRKVTRGEKVVRIIEKAAAKGAALTGRPMNPAASMTDAMLKSMNAEIKVEYSYNEGDEVQWDTSGGMTSGTVQDRTKDSCFNERIDGDIEVCGTEEDPAYLIEVDNEEETMVAHKQSTLTGKSMNTKQLTEEQRTPPQAAQDNAQSFLDAKEEGEVPSECGTGAGTESAEIIASGDPVSEDKIGDIASFARHEDNKEPDVDEGESKWKDCGYAMWKAWGGDEGIRWAQDKNEMINEEKTQHEVKQDYTVQTPDYTAISEASWEKPAMEDFPEDYDVMSIFLARNNDSDNFSDQALPVVDYRNDEATLVLEALRSAHTLAPQVEGLSEDEVEQVKSKAEQLAEDEFDVMIERDDDSAHGDEDKNDTTPMTEPNDEGGDEPEPEEKGETPDSDEGEGEESTPDNEGSEEKSLSDEIQDLKSEFKQVKETNEQLREENESLKSELEDLKTLQTVKEEIDEVKGLVEDIELEDGPRAEKNQERDTASDEKPRWQKTIDGMQNPSKFLESEGKTSSMLDSFVEGKNVSKEEVKNYVNRD